MFRHYWVYFVACDFLDLLGLRKEGVVKSCDLRAINSRALQCLAGFRGRAPAGHPPPLHPASDLARGRIVIKMTKWGQLLRFRMFRDCPW